MQVEVDVLHHTGMIPVYMQIEPDKITWTHGVYTNDPQGFQDAVSAGIRAQLRSTSLVTGQLSIDLDFWFVSVICGWISAIPEVILG